MSNRKLQAAPVAKGKESSETRAQQPARRKVRADGQRNYEQLVRTAKATFLEFGPDVSLETIARKAGVGIGTLYRHFATREVLIQAVCRREVEQLCSDARELLETEEPVEALHKWMRLFVDYVATKKVMSAVVTSMLGIAVEQYANSAAMVTDNPLLGTSTELYQSSTSLIMEAIEALTARAVAAGQIRADITALDLIHAIAGFTITWEKDTDGWEASALLLVEVLVDGLRRPQP